jgi:hypothetical protein
MHGSEKFIRSQRVPGSHNGGGEEITNISQEVRFMQCRTEEEVSGLLLIELLRDDTLEFPPLLQAAVTCRRTLHPQTRLRRLEQRPASLNASPVDSTIVSVVQRGFRVLESHSHRAAADTVGPHDPEKGGREARMD